jgi:hypothetical protein
MDEVALLWVFSKFLWDFPVNHDSIIALYSSFTGSLVSSSYDQAACCYVLCVYSGGASSLIIHLTGHRSRNSGFLKYF